MRDSGGQKSGLGGVEAGNRTGGASHLHRMTRRQNDQGLSQSISSENGEEGMDEGLFLELKELSLGSAYRGAVPEKPAGKKALTIRPEVCRAS